MTKIEEFKTSAFHIKAWEEFRETATGKLLLEVVNEHALGAIKKTSSEQNHSTIFEAGRASGAASSYHLLEGLSAQAVADEEKQRADQLQRLTARMLPSQRAQVHKRLEQNGNPTQ